MIQLTVSEAPAFLINVCLLHCNGLEKTPENYTPSAQPRVLATDVNEGVCKVQVCNVEKAKA